MSLLKSLTLTRNLFRVPVGASPHSSPSSRLILKMSASRTTSLGISAGSISIKPPSHPTYDLKGVIKLALAEDAVDRGDVTCIATIPAYM